ncbi:hypothetical protein FIE12Z_3336 [Fusarium flagelliforme]|uniref:Rhodopsin domain-containing protein n=1 Tax=Fusarium flagelliforme TaxID=2675880 RepID=A0A395MXN3_9HYPO|nr:hypothetical protein FIE12Z_3336 [Fusarium flagelliforme]
MQHATTLIIVQALLIVLSLAVVILRCWTRLHVEGRKLLTADYFAWVGWIFALAWFISSATATRIKYDEDTYVDDEDRVHSVGYLKCVYIAEYCFDIGIYFPKLSITAFYWHLIPNVFRSLRIALYTITTYLACCVTTAFLLNTLIARPISTNWDIENQWDSAWNSMTNFFTQWSMNFSTDLLLFCFPFFMLNHLMLRKEQKLALVGVFSLGAITLAVGLTRLIISRIADYSLDDASGNTLCTAEMTTAVIVVCLPGLKKLIKRSRTPPGTDRGLGYGSAQESDSQPLKSRQATQSYAEYGVRDGEFDDDVPGRTDDDVPEVPEGPEYLRMPDLVFLKGQAQEEDRSVDGNSVQTHEIGYAL